MYRITYIGDGVTNNKLGVFQNGTTANTNDEQLARALSSAPGQWRVTDKDGTIFGGPAPANPESVSAAALETPREQWDRRGKKHKGGDQAAETTEV